MEKDSSRLVQGRAMDVAYEILSSVFGFYPTMDAYEIIAGTQSRHMISDAALLKQTNEFTPRNGGHDYIEAGNKDARFVERQWELNKNQPLEQTYWAYRPQNHFHEQLDGGNLHKELTELMETVLDNGKPLIGSSWENIDLDILKNMNFRDKVVRSATSPFTSVLADDIRNSDWYDILLVPLPSPLSGPIYFGNEYDALQSIVKKYGSTHRDDLNTGRDGLPHDNLYHAVMEFPLSSDKLIGIPINIPKRSCWGSFNTEFSIQGKTYCEELHKLREYYQSQKRCVKFRT